jgi:hypothetical protein
MLPGCVGSIALVARNDPGRLGACQRAPSTLKATRQPHASMGPSAAESRVTRSVRHDVCNVVTLGA